MSLIHSCNLAGVNPFDYPTELERHSDAVQENPEQWLPWNLKHTLIQLAQKSPADTPKKVDYARLPKAHAYCVIIGFTPKGTDNYKSVLLAASENEKLRYIGRVSTGFKAEVRKKLKSELRKRLRDNPIIECSEKALWVELGLYFTIDDKRTEPAAPEPLIYHSSTLPAVFSVEYRFY